MTQPGENLGISDKDLVSKVFWSVVHGLVAIIKLFIPGQDKTEGGFTDTVDDVDFEKKV